MIDTVLVNGIKLYYTDTGDIKSTNIITLIHGFPFSHEMWKPQLESLKKNHRVITYDIRGHGKSEVGDGQYTLELFVDDLIGLLDHLRIERTIVCGLSMGCLCKKEESCQIRNFKNLFQGFSNKADIWKN